MKSLKNNLVTYASSSFNSIVFWLKRTYYEIKVKIKKSSISILRVFYLWICSSKFLISCNIQIYLLWYRKCSAGFQIYSSASYAFEWAWCGSKRIALIIEIFFIQKQKLCWLRPLSENFVVKTLLRSKIRDFLFKLLR